MDILFDFENVKGKKETRSSWCTLTNSELACELNSSLKIIVCKDQHSTWYVPKNELCLSIHSAWPGWAIVRDYVGVTLLVLSHYYMIGQPT